MLAELNTLIVQSQNIQFLDRQRSMMRIQSDHVTRDTRLTGEKKIVGNNNLVKFSNCNNPARSKEGNTSRFGGRSVMNRDNIVCFTCRLSGHYASQCNKERSSKNSSGEKNQAPYYI